MEVILAKGIVGQALMKRFEEKPRLVMAGEKERHALTSQGSELPQLQFRDLSLPTWIHEIAKELLIVMQAEKSGQEPINAHLKSKKKNRKKKKRGLRI
jgi:hypothetical protein